MTSSLIDSQVSETPRAPIVGTVFPVLLAISFCHLLNDMMQSLLPAIYPKLKVDFGLSFGQIGLVTLCYQMTASILQPMVGFAADKRPTPFSLPVGMGLTLIGLVMLATGAPGIDDVLWTPLPADS